MAYTVRAGDTMSGIAASYGVSLDALEGANPDVADPDLINVGQSLEIPGQVDSFDPTPSPNSYTVQWGDTMSGIADANGVSLDALEAANPDVSDPDVISIGEQLNIPDGDWFQPQPPPPPPPAPTPAPAPDPAPAQAATYTVQPGDTMSGIADACGVSLGDLEAANPQIPDPNWISVGQVLNLPDGASAAPAQPAPVPAPSSGGNAADVARQFLGQSEYQLQPSGALDMDQWVPKDVDCANFVSGCLEAAGLIDHSQRSDAVTQLAANLREAGWRDVPLSQARPGDVVCFDGPEGAYQHVELFNGWNGGSPQFIGSNNILGDGTQAISYDSGSWAYGFHVLQQP
jgi:LysM repeat protein